MMMKSWNSKGMTLFVVEWKFDEMRKRMIFAQAPPHSFLSLTCEQVVLSALKVSFLLLYFFGFLVCIYPSASSVLLLFVVFAPSAADGEFLQVKQDKVPLHCHLLHSRSLQYVSWFSLSSRDSFSLVRSSSLCPFLLLPSLSSLSSALG